MGVRELFTRSIRPPPEPATPNPNDPASVPPSSVGPDQLVNPGDPHGVTIAATDPQYSPPPPTIRPSPWSGWPESWYTPNWSNRPNELADTAWMCIDLNASVLSSMPPYLVAAADTLNADWLRNPNPDVYTSWEEFFKQLAWDYQLGEAFVLATARYSTGWPSRFHVVPPWTVNVELNGSGRRRYTIGEVDVTRDMLHIRYQSTVDDAHGHGPLEAGQYRTVAAETLIRYSTGLAAQGGIPSSILTHPEQLDDEQAEALQTNWLNARLRKLGEPAVLSGGVTWEATQMSPEDMAMLPLLNEHDRRICALLGVPHYLVGVPSGGDSLTYSTVVMMLDLHWRAYLRPKAQMIMSALSEWLLPRGTRVELNRDAYVQPEPLQRAQTAEILNRIRDENGMPVLTVAQIQEAERLTNSTPADLSSGVLR